MKMRIKSRLRPPVQGREGRFPSRPSCRPPSVSFRDQDFVQRGDIPGRPLLVAIGRGTWNNSSCVAAAPPASPVPGLSKGLYLEALCCEDKAFAGIKEGGVKSTGPWEGERARKTAKDERDYVCPQSCSSHCSDMKQNVTEKKQHFCLAEVFFNF